MKLIGIDLDGTLLNSEQKISQKNVTHLIKAAENAMPFICSGREVEDIQNILKEHHLSLPAIGLNGAIGYDGERKLFEFAFDTSSIEVIAALVTAFPTKIYTNIGSYESANYQTHLKEIFNEIGQEFTIDELNYELEYEKSIQSIPYTHIDELLNTAAIKIYKFFIFIPNRAIKKELQNKLQLLTGITVTESAAVNLEIVPQKVSKGLVYSYLENIYQLTDTTRFAIGDSLNDLTLFENADVSFAMRNGHQAIKDIATYITASNDEDGVAEALQMIDTLS